MIMKDSSKHLSISKEITLKLSQLMIRIRHYGKANATSLNNKRNKPRQIYKKHIRSSNKLWNKLTREIKWTKNKRIIITVV